MSYSEALSARLVPRWEPVSRNQLLVVLLFCFFIHQWRKVLRKIAAKTFVWPSWRLWSIIFLSRGLSFMFLSSVCSQGSCNHGDKCCYSHDPERTKEEKMEWFHQLFFFFFKYFYLWTLTGRVQPGWSENDAAVGLHFNGNKNPDSC